MTAYFESIFAAVFVEFEAVRAFIDGTSFKDHSSTEVLAAGIETAAPPARTASHFALPARLASAARLNRPCPISQPIRTARGGKQSRPSTRSGWVLARMTQNRAPGISNVIAFPLPIDAGSEMEKAA